DHKRWIAVDRDPRHGGSKITLGAPHWQCQIHNHVCHAAISEPSLPDVDAPDPGAVDISHDGSNDLWIRAVAIQRPDWEPVGRILHRPKAEPALQWLPHGGPGGNDETDTGPVRTFQYKTIGSSCILRII